MRFGSREICNVVFKAKVPMKIGTETFQIGQPVLYIDSAKTSTVEGAATTVYATGGRGNSRLIAWEGEKTLTFTVEDALLSPISFAMLSGAGLFKQAESQMVHVHTTSTAVTETKDDKVVIDLSKVTTKICDTAPVFVIGVEADGSLTGKKAMGASVANGIITLTDGTFESGEAVFVDYYVKKPGNTISELQIDAGHFAGNYYVEANTLFKRQIDGFDMPAELTFPNVKIQSNFSFSMASTGDPSTFTFTMDALPGYTYFNPNQKVLLAMQIIEDAEEVVDTRESVFLHKDDEKLDEAIVNADGKATDLTSFHDTVPPKAEVPQDKAWKAGTADNAGKWIVDDAT